jgi:hypothetical protein
MMRLFKSLTLAVVLLCSLVFAAHASTVTPFATTDFVIGALTINEPFTVPQAGTYRATIADFGPETPLASFDTLLFVITTTGPISFIDAVDGAGGKGMFDFTGAPGVQYWANIVAQLGSPGAVGLFGAEVSLVPIPPTLLLLGSGLLGLVVMRRRRS